MRKNFRKKHAAFFQIRKPNLLPHMIKALGLDVDQHTVAAHKAAAGILFGDMTNHGYILKLADLFKVGHANRKQKFIILSPIHGRSNRLNIEFGCCISGRTIDRDFFLIDTATHF